MAAQFSKLFGNLAVELEYLDPEMLEEALRVQATLAAEGRPLGLGTVLRNLGYLTAEEMEEILRLQKSDAAAGDLYRREAALFGELAIENGFATRPQIQDALATQSATPQSFKIDVILVQRKIITNEQRKALKKAIGRVVRDAKEAAAKAAEPKPPGTRRTRRSGRTKRPFSGLFLFDPEDAEGE